MVFEWKKFRNIWELPTVYRFTSGPFANKEDADKAIVDELNRIRDGSIYQACPVLLPDKYVEPTTTTTTQPASASATPEADIPAAVTSTGGRRVIKELGVSELTGMKRIRVSYVNGTHVETTCTESFMKKLNDEGFVRSDDGVWSKPTG
jgi:hypothetical protein